MSDIEVEVKMTDFHAYADTESVEVEVEGKFGIVSFVVFYVSRCERFGICGVVTLCLRNIGSFDILIFSRFDNLYVMSMICARINGVCRDDRNLSVHSAEKGQVETSGSQSEQGFKQRRNKPRSYGCRNTRRIFTVEFHILSDPQLKHCGVGGGTYDNVVGRTSASDCRKQFAYGHCENSSFTIDIFDINITVVEIYTAFYVALCVKRFDCKFHTLNKAYDIRFFRAECLDEFRDVRTQRNADIYFVFEFADGNE